MYTCILTIENRDLSCDRLVALIYNHESTQEDWKALVHQLMNFSVEGDESHVSLGDKEEIISDILIYQDVFLVRRAKLLDKGTIQFLCE